MQRWRIARRNRPLGLGVSQGSAQRSRPFDPAALAFLRFAIASVFLAAWSVGRQLHRPNRCAPGALIATAYLGIAPAMLAYLLWAEALTRLSAPQAAAFLYLLPVRATVMAWVWLGEVRTRLTVVGGVVALAGVALTSSEQARPRGPGDVRG
jgi:drug/metabolite transporter (DMT)-like permease